MSKGSGRRKENTKQVEENINKVKFGTLKPSREWEVKKPNANKNDSHSQ